MTITVFISIALPMYILGFFIGSYCGKHAALDEIIYDS